MTTSITEIKVKFSEVHDPKKYWKEGMKYENKYVGT